MSQTYFMMKLLLVAMCLILMACNDGASAGPAGASVPTEANRRIRSRPFLRVSPRTIGQYARFKPDLGDFIVDDDDFFELNKRQNSDDYGHLRFGKREDFDDYGHLRYGRSGDSSRR
ncbi:PREDICTED: uncharacterized protein LOC108565434 [Nicrophorus vespilloides]|uniref:Uncharacterized protein LOC108565434 n=1 Tax=Nicrophorus vespilloides TaxID=110193 RepID=A0ABM1N0M1_NICVS|nr:PREDICTED: uncharacterized protein LOC108565434 [Nicrophorus vespilloides]